MRITILKFFLTLNLAFIQLSSIAYCGSKYTSEFLNIGVGARALAMGGSVVAHTNNASAIYWNPAALSNLNKNQLYLSHVRMFDNIANHNFMGLGFNVSNGLSFGLGWLRLSIDDIPYYSELEGSRYDRIMNPDMRSTGEAEGYFGDVEEAYFLTVAKSMDLDLMFGNELVPIIIPFRISLGVNYKIINQKLAESEGKGQGLDCGILFQFLDFNGTSRTQIFCVGFNAKDIVGTTIVWNTQNHTREKIPIQFDCGTSYSRWFHTMRSKITVSLAYEMLEINTIRCGFEYSFADLLFLRSGMNDNKWTSGAGLKLMFIHLDYAFISHDLGNTHRISGSFQF